MTAYSSNSSVHPLPDDEAQRLRALHNLEILDTDPDPTFDLLAKTAATIFGTPQAFISFVDESRQWFKSKYGSETAQTPRDVAFCSFTIRRHGVTVVLNAREDARFRDNPLVCGPPGIRFYAGAPLRLKDCQNVGALCVIDTKPRDRFTPQQEETLKRLAELVCEALEAHKELVAQNRKNEELQNGVVTP
jgi:GAF domain-containing protein